MAMQPSRRAPQVLFVLLFLAIAAFADVAYEFALVSDPGVVPLHALAHALAWLLPGTAAGLALVYFGRPRAGYALAFAVASAFLLWGAADASTRAVFGNPLSFYVAHLGQPDALHWAGSPKSLVPLFGSYVVGLVLFLVAVVAGGGVLAWRVSRSLAPRWAERAALAIGVAWLLLATGGLAAGLITSNAARSANAFPEPRIRSEAPRSAFASRDSARTSVPSSEARCAPSVILVILESMRADALVPEFMPRLSRLSEKGTRFALHYSNAPHSHEGVFSLVVGRYPIGVNRYTTTPPLVSALGRAGYEMHAFLSARAAWMGIQRFVGPSHFTIHEANSGSNWERDQKTVARARAFLRETDVPRLVLVYPVAMHWPYVYPPSYAPHDEPVAPLPADRRSSMFSGARRIFAAMSTNHQEVAKIYYRSARFIDDLLGDWLESLDPECNLLIVTGDHGESLGEYGVYSHGSRLSDEQTRVPLFMVGRGVSQGIVRNDLTEHVDIAPTILWLLGFPPDPSLHGRRLFPSRDGSAGFVALFSPRGVKPAAAFVSRDRRFLLNRRPASGPMGIRSKLDATGLPTQERVTALDRSVFRAWMNDFAGRAEHRFPEYRDSAEAVGDDSVLIVD